MGTGNHGPKGSWAQGEVTGPEITSWEPEFTCFGRGNRGPVGKRDRGLRQPEVTWFGRGNRGPVRKKGSRAQVTGSHVVWNGKPLSRWKKGSWAQGGQKPRSNAGSKSKVQLEHRRWSLEFKKKIDAMLEKKFNARFPWVFYKRNPLVFL